jgi:hypothetical protein
VNGPQASLNTWYQIDIKAYCGAATYILDWQVDGVSQTQATYATTASTFSSIRPGVIISASVTNYIDDVAVSVTPEDYPIGEGGTVGLRPNADGTHNNAANIMEDSAGTDIDGTPAWNLLEENPWITTANADYVRQSGIGTGNYGEVQFADTDKTTIHGVMAVLQYASATDLANDGKTYIRDLDGQATTLYSGDMSETSCFYKSVAVLTPSGGWTLAHVNGLRARIGYSSDADPAPYWLGIMLEVAYGPSSSAPEMNVRYQSTNIADGGSYDFSSQVVGTNTDRVFTTENLGDANLTLSGSPIITIGGTNADQFSVQSQPSTPILPSGYTTFTIRFSPTSTGAKTATISIVNNDTDENPYDITFTGTGIGVPVQNALFIFIGLLAITAYRNRRKFR